MIDYRTPPLGYLVRVPQESVDSPLDAGARLRAEEAARWLSYQQFGYVISSHCSAAAETAEIINLARGIGERLEYGGPIPATLTESYLNSGECCVQVLDGAEIAAAVAKLTGADVCGEIVAPGGIVSIHRGGDGGIVARARTMVLDFTFTDCVQAVAGAEC